MSDYILIDVPITSFSTQEDIDEWLEILQAMDQNNKQVKDAAKWTDEIIKRNKKLQAVTTEN